MRRLELGAGHVGLFGYGSLLLRSSMERTLGRRYESEPMPCRLRGWRRTWDSIYPNERFFYEAGGERVVPAHIIYLNISPAAAVLNGLVYAITEQELAGFDAREAVYERIDVRDALVDLEVTGGPVWAYVGKEPYVLRSVAAPHEAAVRQTYLDIVDSGLSELGEAFRAEYLASSDPPPSANIVNDRVA